jgi:hypothetical protein
MSFAFRRVVAALREDGLVKFLSNLYQTDARLKQYLCIVSQLRGRD